MAKKLIETIYGKTSKYEIYSVEGVFTGPDFYLYRNGKYLGSYSRLDKAVEAAKNKG